jgi:hypothetical protein
MFGWACVAEISRDRLAQPTTTTRTNAHRAREEAFRMNNLTARGGNGFILYRWMRRPPKALPLTALAILCGAACGPASTRDAGQPRESAAATGDSMAIAPAFAVPPIPGILTCSPDVLRPGGVLTMRMKVPHGASFHAISPDRTPYIVVFHGEGSPDRTGRKSLMPPDSFAKVAELNIDPATLKAGVWVFGRDTNEILFRRAGTYRLHVGSDMETDGPQYAECLVRWAP